MSTTVARTTRPRLSTKQKVGLVLCMVFSLTSLPSAFMSDPDPGGDGPPLPIEVLSTVLGVIGVVAVVLAWRGSSVSLRIAAGTVIVNTLTSLPAFFVDVPLWIKVLVAVGVVYCVITVVLMFSGQRRTAPVTD